MGQGFTKGIDGHAELVKVVQEHVGTVPATYATKSGQDSVRITLENPTKPPHPRRLVIQGHLPLRTVSVPKNNLSQEDMQAHEVHRVLSMDICGV